MLYFQWNSSGVFYLGIKKGIMGNLKEKVASGLRYMKNRPDAFLFCDAEIDWTWDRSDICGIPVFHVEMINDHRWGNEIEDVLFIHIWREENNHREDRQNFTDGYLQWSPPSELCQKADQEYLEENK